MPRRWGKSNNLNMLKRFFEIEVDTDGNPLNEQDRINSINYKLFAGGEILIKNKKHIFNKLKIAE